MFTDDDKTLITYPTYPMNLPNMSICRPLVIQASRCLLVFSIVGPIVAQTSPVVALTPLVETGDVVPGVGTVTRIDEFAVNDAGEWIVEVATDHPDDERDQVVLHNGVVILREGDALAEPPGATMALVDVPYLDNDGGLASNPVDLGTGDPGVVHRLRWDFRSEESWNGDDGLRRHVTLTARVQGAEELEARLEGISVGNDAPRLMLEELDTSGESLVSVSFSLSDSSDDEVDVFAEFDLVDDLPDAGWRRASHWGASGRYDGSRSCSARGPAVMQ